MAFQIVHIPDLPVASSIVATDRFIVETSDGTKSATQSVIDTYGASKYLRKNVNDSTTGIITAAGFTATSTKKYKEDIIPLTVEVIDDLVKLDPVVFTFKKDSPVRPGQVDVGLIAEDVDKHVSLLVHADEKGDLSVDYAKLSVYLLVAVKDLIARVNELENK